MRWRLPSGRTRTVGAFTALSIGLATMAVLHDGTVVADVDLNDGGVWVTNRNLNGLQVGAHLNYPSKQLDANTKSLAGEGFDLSQEANHVVAHTNGTELSAVDTTTWALDPTPGQFPAGSHASQGSARVAVADPSAGKLWVLPSNEVASFNVESTAPLLKGRTGIRAVVGKDDVVHTVTPDGTLTSIRRENGAWVTEKVGRVPEVADEEMASVTITAVGSTPVVLNRAAGWLAWPEGRHDLDDAEGLVLQPPGTASATIALAGTSGLLQVPLDGTAVRTLDAPSGGQPVAPVTVGECTYAAWVGTGAYLRDCTDDRDDTAVAVHEQLKPNTELVFRTNRDVVVLNDPSNGDVILVNEQMEKLNDWSMVLANLNQDQKDEQDPTITTVERSEENTPPKPADDEFGVRPGASVTLPVLANDLDADGDVLVAELKDTKLPGLGHVELVRQGRAVRLQVAADARPGSRSTFTYTASDGRKDGTADAEVTVQVRDPGANGAVEQLAPVQSEVSLRTRGEASQHVLGDWKDTDGDPFWVAGVEFGEGLTGTYRADGKVTVRDTGQPDLPRKRTVKVTLTDGRPGGSRTVDLPVTVFPADHRGKPVAHADFVTALAAEVPGSQPVTLRPLANDTDPAGGELFLSLGQVPAGVKATVGKDNSVTVRPGRAGTAYLPYTLGNGKHQVTSVIRLDTLTPQEARPVPDNDLAVVPPHGDLLVPVLDNDTDPLGGVLVVQSAQTDSPDVSVEVVDHELVRVKDVNLTEGRPVTLTYEVGNGVASGTGQVTVVLDPDRENAPPIVHDDRAVVRAGDVVTVPVLANDSSPGDLPLEVLPSAEDAISTGADLGTAWVSENKLRFKAHPDTVGGQVRVTYTVADTRKRAQSAVVEIAVVPASGPNSAPTPPQVTGRLVQGHSVRLPVSLDGVDPEGDSVSIVGLAPDGVPGKGSVSIDADVLTYTPAGGEENRGTDSFGIVVEDEYGAQARAEVRVGIAAPPSSNLPPVAQADLREVQPGRMVSVPVVGNDLDPEGATLKLLSEVEQVKGPETPVDLTRGRLEVRVPDEPTRLVYRYTVEDDLGARSSADLTIRVTPDAPVLPPVVRDDRVPAVSVLGKSEVTVDVLTNDEDPDGAVGELTPEVDTPGVTVAPDGRLVVPVKAERQVVLYSLTDPDGGRGSAVVVVPGARSKAVQRPAVRPGAELPIKVDAGTKASVDLADYVVVREGRTASLPYGEQLAAGPGHDGSPLKTGDAQITFGAAKKFHGATSVVFTVSDATGEGDASALTNTLTLPVFVNADGNTPPTLTVPQVRTAAEEPWTGDLSTMATDPDPGDTEKLEFGVEKVPAELQVEVDDDTLRVEPGGDARPGQYQFTLTVTDGRTAPVAKVVDVTVVDTVRPLLALSEAQLEGVSGETVEVDLAGQVTFNPFEGEEAPHLVGNPQVVAGAGTVSATGLRLALTPAADFYGTLRVTYLMADKTGQPDRQVQGQVLVDVKGVPDAPSAVLAEAGNAQVTVQWASPEPNGSPLTGYRLEWQGGSTGSMDLGPQTTATATGLRNGQAYRFRVVARNAVGESRAASEWSREVTPDDVPSAPTDVKASFGDGSLVVSWTPPRYEGSPVRRYVVSANGVETEVGTATSTILNGLTNGTSYDVKVRAFNDAEADPYGEVGAGPWSGVVTEHPNGLPQVTQVAIVADAPDADPSAVISWTVDDHGHAVERVEVRRSGGAVVPCAAGAGTSCRVSLAGGGRDQQFQVRVFNRANPDRQVAGWGDWSASTMKVTGATPPAPVSDLQAVATGVSGQALVRFRYPSASLNNADRVEFFTNRTGATPVASGTGTHEVAVNGLPNGKVTDVQVWAVSYANEAAGGGRSEPANRLTSPVNAFAPCTISVGAGRSGFESVRFPWSYTSHGRPCTVRAPIEGDRVENSQGLEIRNGTGGSGELVARTEPHNTCSFDGAAQAGTCWMDTADREQVTLVGAVITEYRPGDEPRADMEMVVRGYGKPFRPRASKYGYRDVGNRGGCTKNCSAFTVTLSEFKPNSDVFCWIGPGWGTNKTGIFRIRVDGNGNHAGPFATTQAFDRSALGAYPENPDLCGPRSMFTNVTVHDN